MSDDFDELRLATIQFLSSLRQSVDRRYRIRPSLNEDSRERFTRMMLLIEEARIRFNVYARQERNPSPEQAAAAVEIILSFINNFLNSDIDRSVFNLRFGPLPSPITRDRITPVLRHLDEIKPTIGEALYLFRSYISDSRGWKPKEQLALELGDLRSIMPSQQVAPVQFEVTTGKIRVLRQPPEVLEGDKQNIKSALDHIRSGGDKLMASLERSNCDRRLLESIKELQSQLIDNGNIVQIGLTNMACGIMCTQFQGELPDAVFAMFNAYNSSISMYVAQYPEWQQFAQKAAQTELNDADVVEIDNATGEIIRYLGENPDIADPDVPKTIAFVRNFLKSPSNSAKRAAFAMIRTIENLVSSIVKHAADLVEKTASKTVEGVSTAASKAIIGLLSLALIGASGIGSAAMHAGAPWVKQAAEIVQKQIEKMAQ